MLPPPRLYANSEGVNGIAKKTVTILVAFFLHFKGECVIIGQNKCSERMYSGWEVINES